MQAMGMKTGAERDTKGRIAAFTLIELLTVLGIMIVLLAVTVPAASSLMKGNNQKQAVNMASAFVMSARATAMSSKTPVAVVFFEDSNNKNQTAVQLIKQVSENAMGVASFDVIDGRKMEYLPRGIKVSVLQGNGTMTTETSTPSRVILFNGSGQLVLRSGISGSYGDWNLTGVGGFSSPAILVYDTVQYQGAVDRNENASTWLQKNGDVLVINAYTGNVIR